MRGRLNRNFWHKHEHTVIIYVFLAALMVLVSIFSRDFLTLGNLGNLLRFSFPLFTTALGQTLIILVGGIDLSLGGTVALYDVVCVTSMNSDSTWESVSAPRAAAVVGLAYGAANGILTAKEHLTPIIVTIATTAVFDGMASLPIPNPGRSVHRASTKPPIRGYSDTVLFLLFILILCLVRSPANGTSHRKVLRATGGSENVAYSTGVWVGKIKFCVHYPAGLLCAVAGVLLSAQMNSADAAIGKDYAANAITAAMVGGIAMAGVVGDPLGAIADVFTTSIINNTLNLFGVSSLY